MILWMKLYMRRSIGPETVGSASSSISLVPASTDLFQSTCELFLQSKPARRDVQGTEQN